MTRTLRKGRRLRFKKQTLVRNAPFVESARSGMRFFTIVFAILRLLTYRLIHRRRKNFDEQFAREIRETLESLGPVYIKLGQILSMRPDYISDVYCHEFESLLDAGKPIPRSKMRTYLKCISHSGQKEIVAQLDHPVAVASLSEVYKVTSASGTTLAVKVLRPGVREMVRQDFSILKKLIKLIGHRFGRTDRAHWVDLVCEIEKWLLEETNYFYEMRNIEAMRRDLVSFDNIIIPRAYPELSSKNIFVMDWINGYSMLELIRMKRKGELPEFPFSLEEKLEELIHDVAIKSLLRGYFHADLNPANIIITNDGKIALIDFGLIKFFSKEARRGTILFLLGITSNSPELIFKSAELFAKNGSSYNREEVYEDLSKLLYDYSGMPAKDVSSTRVILDILKLSLNQGFEYPWSLILYTRSAVNLDGQVLRLHPDFSFSDYGSSRLLEVYTQAFIDEHLSVSHLVDVSEDVVAVLKDLPKNVGTILHTMVTKNKTTN
ncbi:AarF/ABC1/UbiB kinase family protein [Patescibacteria group bacterium]|nr:AarF/ABC1/UbiB kinase family protein [Patescibacteria group bacterium]